MSRNNSSHKHKSLKKTAGLIKSLMTCNKEMRTWATWWGHQCTLKLSNTDPKLCQLWQETISLPSNKTKEGDQPPQKPLKSSATPLSKEITRNKGAKKTRKWELRAKLSPLVQCLIWICHKLRTRIWIWTWLSQTNSPKTSPNNATHQSTMRTIQCSISPIMSSHISTLIIWVM